MGHKLLVICGPTATGKTRLALHLSKVFNGELVSADSRQVYKGMDIGTGKDIPKNLKTKKLKNSRLPEFYEIEKVRIWGYDLVSPKKEFSVAQYIRIAKKIIDDIWKRGKLPILIGGTGLYIKGIVDEIATASVPKNISLRKSLEYKNAGELFEILAQVDALKAASMNASDRKNPRRLIRAIEVAQQKVGVRGRVSGKTLRIYDTLFVGLTAPKEVLHRNIKNRVEERIKQGIKEEIIKLLASGVSWESQAMSSLGYKQWKEYFRDAGEVKGKVRVRVIEKWTVDEKNYAKRQITWFKKDKRINWFDTTMSGWKVRVEKLVGKWYKS